MTSDSFVPEEASEPAKSAEAEPVITVIIPAEKAAEAAVMGAGPGVSILMVSTVAFEHVVHIP